MRKATRTVAAAFGIVAGLAGLEHGFFEILQGNVRPAGLMFPSMGPPCVPHEMWNACEPAMTILPNLLITGLLAVILSLLILIWSAVFIGRKHGGLVLIILSITLLLFGGGIFPPLIGLVGGLAGTRINKPLPARPASRITYLAARLWPWPLVIFIVWVFGQNLVGYLFNDFLQGIMVYGMFLIIFMLPLAVYSGYAHDCMRAGSAKQ